MAARMNRFSPATRGTPVVAGEDGERDVASESAAQNHDPAPADLSEKYRKVLLAYEAGKQAKLAGKSRGANPHDAEAIAWIAGYNGESLED